tara:strand:- start:875 stop:1111 length:237 start_codon:yes stop_codon:yes gene_type:complete
MSKHISKINIETYVEINSTGDFTVITYIGDGDPTVEGSVSFKSILEELCSHTNLEERAKIFDIMRSQMVVYDKERKES